MRIALITARSPLRHPAEGTLHETALARAMAAHGHRVTVYCRAEQAGGPRTAILGGGVSVEFVPAGPARPLSPEQTATYLPAFAAFLSDRWRTKRPDVVHAFSWTSGLVALGAVRGTDIPVVQSFGSLGIAERRLDGQTVSACRVKLEQSVGRAADAVLAASSDEAADLARMSVPKTAVRVIPCGIDTSEFSPQGPVAESDAPRRVITFASTPDARGVDSVIRAIAQLPGTELVIVGGPDARHLPKTGPFRELAKLASALKIRNRVVFAGQPDAGELPALLRSADVMASASGHEPDGIAAVQAMACGIPVVVAGVGAHRDAVIDGINGLLVAPHYPAMLAHRLHHLLSKPALLQAYGIAAADRASSRYGIDRIGLETVAVYERCLRARTAVSAASVEAQLAELDAELDAAAPVELDLRGVAALA
jgi:D-inositol-3-phosphate glycosyltransferase